MKKEEILAKARKQNKGKLDEWELSINHMAAKVAMTVSILMSFALFIFNQQNGEFYQDIFAIYALTLSVYWGYRGWKQKEWLYIFDAVLFFAGGVMMLIGYVMHVLGV